MPNKLDCIIQNVLGHPMPRDANDRHETRRTFSAGTPTRRNNSTSPQASGRSRWHTVGPATPPPHPTRTPRRQEELTPTRCNEPRTPVNREQRRHRPADRTPPNQGAGYRNRARRNIRQERHHSRPHHPNCPASNWQRWNTAQRIAPGDRLRRPARPLDATNPARDHDDDDSFYRRYRTTNHYSTTEEIICRNSHTPSQARDTRTTQANGHQRNTTTRINGQTINPAPRRHLNEHPNNVENIANRAGILTSTPLPDRRNRPSAD